VRRGANPPLRVSYSFVLLPLSHSGCCLSPSISTVLFLRIQYSTMRLSCPLRGDQPHNPWSSLSLLPTLPEPHSATYHSIAFFWCQSPPAMTLPPQTPWRGGCPTEHTHLPCPSFSLVLAAEMYRHAHGSVILSILFFFPPPVTVSY